MMRARALALALLALGECRGKVTRAECDAMLGHYVEMTAARDPSLAPLSPAQAAEARAQLVTRKRAAPEFARAEEECLHEVSRAELECAMKTDSPNDWEACIE